MIRTMLLGLVVLGVFAGIAPKAAATHMVNCDISDSETVNDAYCAPHRLWDCLSGTYWKQWSRCVKG